jgi:hypothetical protein
MPPRSTRPRLARAPLRPQTQGSLEEWLRYFGVNTQDARLFSVWPPDLFAIAAAYLRRTGGYVGLIGRLQGLREKRHHGLAPAPEAVGQAWRNALREGLSRKFPKQSILIPSQIGEWWRIFVQQKSKSFDTSARDADVQAAAWNLCIAADVACEGLGTRGAGKDLFLGVAHNVLVSNNLRSYCLSIPPEKLSVLGKRHTPQRGCTIRSLSHHLALYSPSEIIARWHGPFGAASDRLEVFNLLLLPWPTSVNASDFQLVPSSGDVNERMHRFFRYRPSAPERPRAFGRKISRALKSACVHADRIHGIVFPELALDLGQFVAAERVAIRNRAMLIAGVGVEPRDSPSKLPLNMCAIQPYGLSDAPNDPEFRKPNRLSEQMRQTQYKHHQWCLDGSQIMQYELGARLPASHECWEDIDIVERRVNFTTLSSWLTMCVLICEDLARQDPVADVMRAVGPNLVVALLMDGPQLRHRWAARYASVLAEDPGCSVLSLTSAGMSSRSKPREEPGAASVNKSRVIALWRDAFTGDREIALEPGHDACVLSLVCRSKREYSLDGRSDDQSYYPVFAGAYSFDSQRGAAP